MTARTTVISRVPILFTSAAGTLTKHFILSVLTKELYFTSLTFKNFSPENSVAQRKQTIFLMTRDRNSPSKSPRWDVSPLLRTSSSKSSNQVRQDSGERYETNPKTQNVSPIHRKPSSFRLGGRNLGKKEILKGEGWLCISLLGFHYVVRRGKDTSGKNCQDRAWQLNLFPVFLVSWFTYSRSVFTVIAPPYLLWFGKHISVLPHHRKWLQIKASLNQEAVKNLLKVKRRWAAGNAGKHNGTETRACTSLSVNHPF